ncbi:MAG TPA: hypothetical protein VFL86_11210, partial [Burkholderiaceae bacterium]|nr:hypothetical protein [Burkholderiaceae bacterium]
AALNTGTRLGFTSIEGFIAGQVAVEAARTAAKGGAAVTRSRFREVLASTRTDLGGYKVDFNGSRNGSRFVDVIAVDRQGRLIG